jgi:protein MpaA
MRPRRLLPLACLLVAGCGAAGHRAAAPAATPSPLARAAAPTATPSPAPPPRALRPLLRPIGPRLIAAQPIGRSARGRRIVATVSGDPLAAHRVLVVGCIHGNECAGMAVTRRLLRGPRGCPPAGADVWSIPDLNPDGQAAGTRVNGRGVDLNHNFSAAWRPFGRRWDLEYSGPAPFSERETRLARRVVVAFRPQVTIWFHQQAEALVRAWGPSVPAARRYARAVGLPFRRMPWIAGSAPHWQNTAFRGTASFVVELAPGPLAARDAARHARAVFALAGVGG